MGLPIWARFVRVSGAGKTVPGTIGEPVEVGGATIRQGDVVVLDEDGAVVVERVRVDDVLAGGTRTRRARAREAREARGKRALVRPRRPAGARRAVTEPLHDVARIAHAELLTPEPDASLAFFVDVLGMEEEARDGQSVFLRGWGDYLRYSLKLTESPQAGLGHVALRAWSPEALERSVAAIEANGARRRLVDGDVGTARLSLHRSGRPRLRALLRGRALRGSRPSAAVVAQPAAAVRRAWRGGQAARPRQRPRGRRPGEPDVRAGRPRLPPVRTDRAGRRNRGGAWMSPRSRLTS